MLVETNENVAIVTRRTLEKEFNQIHTGKLQDHCSHRFDPPIKGLAG